MIHLSGKQREHCGKRGAHNAIACHRGRCNRSIRDNEIRERGREDEIRSCAKWHRRDNGRNPVNMFICGEGQAEEADRDEYPTDLAHYETELRRRIAILLE